MGRCPCYWDSYHGNIDDKNLAGFSIEDRVSRLHPNSVSNTQTVVDDKRPVGKECLTVPGVEEGDDDGEIKPNVKPETRTPRGENTMFSPPATGSAGEPQVRLDQFLEKMLPAFIKTVKPSVPNFSGDPLEYSNLKQQWKWAKRRFMMLQRSLN